jgi:hypothetical protein
VVQFAHMTLKRGDPRIRAKYQKNREHYRAYAREYARMHPKAYWKRWLSRFRRAVRLAIPSVKADLIRALNVLTPNPRTWTASYRALRGSVNANLSSKRDWVNSYKRTHPCEDCGEFLLPFILDFDHRDSSLKFNNIATMVYANYSLSRIKAEIEKCDLVCANCHRIRTHKRTHKEDTPCLVCISPI